MVTHNRWRWSGIVTAAILMYGGFQFTGLTSLVAHGSTTRLEPGTLRPANLASLAAST
jgi:hypothetical protein